MEDLLPSAGMERDGPAPTHREPPVPEQDGARERTSGCDRTDGHGEWRARRIETSRPLRYRVETVRLPDGSVHEVPVDREKGVDLRLGLDVVRMARNAEIDVAIMFSQDQRSG